MFAFWRTRRYKPCRSARRCRGIRASAWGVLG
jgi:hypothetical protein